MTNNPLQKRTRKEVVTDVVVGGITIGITALIGVFVFGPLTQLGNNTPEPEPTSIIQKGVGEPIEIPTPTPTPTEVLPEPLPLEPLPEVQPEPELEPYVPTLCPPGTVPNAVDDLGNESGCSVPCNAWSDLDGDGIAETCTASLRYTIREPEAVLA